MEKGREIETERIGPDKRIKKVGKEKRGEQRREVERGERREERGERREERRGISTLDSNPKSST